MQAAATRARHFWLTRGAPAPEPTKATMAAHSKRREVAAATRATVLGATRRCNACAGATASNAMLVTDGRGERGALCLLPVCAALSSIFGSPCRVRDHKKKQMYTDMSVTAHPECSAEERLRVVGSETPVGLCSLQGSRRIGTVHSGPGACLRVHASGSRGN